MSAARAVDGRRAAPTAPSLGLGVQVAAVASNIECPRCGDVSSDFVRGVCRTRYMRDYNQRRSASSVTVIHDRYGRRLCIGCHEPGTYAHGFCAKMLHAGLSPPPLDALDLCKLWRLVSRNTPGRSLLLTVLPNARTPRCSIYERRSVMRRAGAEPWAVARLNAVAAT